MLISEKPVKAKFGEFLYPILQNFLFHTVRQKRLEIHNSLPSASSSACPFHLLDTLLGQIGPEVDVRSVLPLVTLILVSRDVTLQVRGLVPSALPYSLARFSARIRSK